MAFLRVDGYEIPVLVDSIGDADATVESFGRAQDDALTGTVYSAKREYEFETPPMPLSDAVAVASWVRGRGHHWSFQRPDTATTRFSLVSDEAGHTFTAGTSTSSSLFGPWALQLLSGFTSSATVNFGSEADWTVQVYHRTTAGQPFLSRVVRFKDGVTDYWVSGATTAGPFTLTDPMSVSASSGFVGVALSGRATGGSAATAQFGGVRVVPYALNEGQILALATPFFGNPTTGWARKPFVSVTGDMLSIGGPVVNGAGERGGQHFKGAVEGTAIQPVVIDGAFRYNARGVKGRLVLR